MARTKPEFKEVPYTKLKFDPSNPRFETGLGANISQESIQKLLESEPHLALQLVDSFLENGFIDYEPLVVKQSGDDYTVVEGNRRLAAINYIMNNRESYQGDSERLGDLEMIPVLVFPSQTSEQEQKEQRVYLGVRHLFGFRDWPPESKARFLDAQIKKDEDLINLLKELSIKRSDISRYLIPYRLRKLAKDLWKPYSQEDFWLMGEGINRAGIKEYIALEVDRQTLKIKKFDSKRLKKLLEFIYGVVSDGKKLGKKIKESRDLSVLADLLRVPKAREALEKGASLTEAALLLETSDESILRLSQLLRELNVLVNNVLKVKGANVSTDKLSNSFKAFSSEAKEFIKNVKKSGF